MELWQIAYIKIGYTQESKMAPTNAETLDDVENEALLECRRICRNNKIMLSYTQENTYKVMWGFTQLGWVVIR